MQLVCHHDPADPNHLICETKLPWKHRVVEIGIGALTLLLLIIGVFFFVKAPPVDKVRFELEKVVGEGEPAQISAPQKFQSGLDESPQYSGQSEIFLEAEAVYYSKEGEQLGRGPWPPKVGETTKLMVFWKLKLDRESLALSLTKLSFDGVIVSGRLGPNVEWTGFTPQRAGLSYDPQLRKVFWHPASLNVTATFEVAVQPARAQLAEPRLLIVEELTLKNRQGQKVLFPNLTLDLPQ